MSTKISRITYKLRNAQPVPKPTRKQTHANLVSHYCALCGNWDERAKLGQADELGQKIFGTKFMKNSNFCEETSTVWRFKIFELLFFSLRCTRNTRQRVRCTDEKEAVHSLALLQKIIWRKNLEKFKKSGENRKKSGENGPPKNWDVPISAQGAVPLCPLVHKCLPHHLRAASRTTQECARFVAQTKHTQTSSVMANLTTLRARPQMSPASLLTRCITQRKSAPDSSRTQTHANLVSHFHFARLSTNVSRVTHPLHHAQPMSVPDSSTSRKSKTSSVTTTLTTLPA
jgi:hypothetical protein